MEARSSTFRYKRTWNACDACRARKAKCDGKSPCELCSRRLQAHLCQYSSVRKSNKRPKASRAPRDPQQLSTLVPVAQSHPIEPPSRPRTEIRSSSSIDAASQTRDASDDQAGLEDADDDTEVPREARLHADAEGKLIFIGDCAPLSFFQSVRQLVNAKISHKAFDPEKSRYSGLENVPSRRQTQRWPVDPGSIVDWSGPRRDIPNIQLAVDRYLATTAGLLDFFDEARLRRDLAAWPSYQRHSPNATSSLYYLVLAIGLQLQEPDIAQQYFEHAREKAYADLTVDVGVEAIQVFVLITTYMISSCQINGAFLFFGIAARAAYSIGIHRTEVNARFGPEGHVQRDKLWKSLRVVDLLLSISMGRPPATSDVDCTVPYEDKDADGNERYNILNASAQILLITEAIVTDIYSRRKISLQLTERFSRKLRDWSYRWLEHLERLKKSIDTSQAPVDEIIGAGVCQVLSTYYYAIMLVSRPLLMFTVTQQLSDGNMTRSLTPNGGKSRLADACVDAASQMVDNVMELIERGTLVVRLPFVVSWLFASSLVLGLGLLGGFDRILEKYTETSIQALDHFAQNDTHARQYFYIAQALLRTARDYLQHQELADRKRRTESSNQLFGLQVDASRWKSHLDPSDTRRRAYSDNTIPQPMHRILQEPEPVRSFDSEGLEASTTDVHEAESIFPELGNLNLQASDVNSWNFDFGEGDTDMTLNLFPLLGAGTVDLANYIQ